MIASRLPFPFMFWLLLFGCVNDHAVAPAFECPSQPLSYDDIAVIVQTKCATPTCHVHANSSIPSLTTVSEFTANRFDAWTQLQSGAMPPSNSVVLTPDERAKLLCWISSRLQ